MTPNKHVKNGNGLLIVSEKQMHILCDTSSILLLIRIAPDMFIDPRYQCCTIKEVHDELFQTQKFKQKYPWRNAYRDKIICLPVTQKEQEIASFSEVIFLLNEAGTRDMYTGRIFSLSSRDIKLLACALANGYKLSTGDAGIMNMAHQQFDEIYKGSVSALELINLWLRNRLITWNDTLHEYIADWYRQAEHPQLNDQKKIFKRLTKRDYPGS